MNSRVRELREKLGWSQGELAEQLEVSRQTVNAIETGKYDPSLPLAFRIARLFGKSIEAIFLTLFVLASQNRMARQADQRSHLDLQIDLLAEREMTAVLQLLQDIARHLIRMKKSRPETVWRHVYGGRQSLWALSHSGPVDRTMNKYYFSQRGYLSLEALYRGQPRFVIAQEQLTLDLDSCGRKRRRRNKGSSSPTPRVPTSRM